MYIFGKWRKSTLSGNERTHLKLYLQFYTKDSLNVTQVPALLGGWHKIKMQFYAQKLRAASEMAQWAPTGVSF